MELLVAALLLLFMTFDPEAADTVAEEVNGFLDATAEVPAPAAAAAVDNDDSDALDFDGLEEGPLSGVSVADDPPS